MTSRFVTGLATAIFLWVSLTVDSPALAGDLVGPDLTLYRTDVTQDLPAIAYNSTHDEYLVVWEDQGTTAHDIRALRLSATGGELAQFTVASDNDNRSWPAVAYDPVGDQYLVTYEKEYSPTDTDIVGRFIPWDGPDSNLAEFIIAGQTYDEVRPDVAYGKGSPPGGQFLVVMTAHIGSEWMVRGAFVNPDGSGFGTRWRITPAPGLYDWAAVAYLDTRDQFMVVAAGADSPTATDENVYGVILDTSGNPLHGGMFGIATSSEDETFPDVAAFPAADQYLVTFARSYTDLDIKAQRVTGDGALDGPMIDLNRSPFRAIRQRPACLASSPGVCLVIWVQAVDAVSSAHAIIGSVLGAEGPPGPLITVIDASVASASRSQPALAAGSPDFFAVWRHERDDATSDDLHGSLVMPVIFCDGLESSDTSRWSSHSP